MLFNYCWLQLISLPANAFCSTFVLQLFLLFLFLFAFNWFKRNSHVPEQLRPFGHLRKTKQHSDRQTDGQTNKQSLPSYWRCYCHHRWAFNTHCHHRRQRQRCKTSYLFFVLLLLFEDLYNCWFTTLIINK